MEDFNLGGEIGKLKNSKFFTKLKENKIKRHIRMAMVLNELEKEAAVKKRLSFASVWAFLTHGEPKLPILKDDSDLDMELGQKFLLKLAQFPISILYLPLVAAKMGINAIKLKKWLSQKREILHSLKVQDLLDNIDRFSNQEKATFKLNTFKEFVDHVLGKKRIFPGKYSQLIDEMGAEFRNTLLSRNNGSDIDPDFEAMFVR